MRRLIATGPILVALALGLGIALVDTSPGWDDTGISAAALLTTSGVFGSVWPQRPLLWAAAIGSWTPLLSITLDPRHPNFASLLALAVTLIGAYGGALARIVARIS
jgi:hypothetical protein